MKAHQSKSFRTYLEDGQIVWDYSGNYHLKNTRSQPAETGIDWMWMLNQFSNGLVKLFVALKYLLLVLLWRPVRSQNLPWLKIGFLSVAAFFLLRSDFRYHISDRTQLKTSREFTSPKESKLSSWLAFDGLLRKPVDLDSKDNPFVPLPTDELTDRKAKEYILRYAKIAVVEMHKFGIPASVKMAQALIETGNGESALARKNNNHFGVKCFSNKCKKGHCSNFGDDHHKDFFRKYGSAWESWRAHSQMISTGKYKTLITKGNDYESWAHGLKKMGYATDKNYNTKLIETIEKYQLQLLDDL